MSVTREELAAFADGELAEPRRSEVAAAVAADGALANEVGRHRELKGILAARFAPILDAPVPERLTAPLAISDKKVADFADAKQKRAARGIPRWVVAPAMAASLALAVFMSHGGAELEGYAEPQLASALDNQLVDSQTRSAPTRVLLSFRNNSGQFCRAYTGRRGSGIACKDRNGWRLHANGTGGEAQRADYRMAGSSSADIMQKAQEMASGPALSSEEERAARAKGWR
jgi:hypothetical protein